MNGLFHRLASQVVGPPPLRVHAMARLPFSEPPELKQDDASGLGVAAEAAMPGRVPAMARVDRNESGEAAARTAPPGAPAGDADAAPRPMPRMPAGLVEGRDAAPVEMRLPENELGLQDARGEAPPRAGQGAILPTGARVQTHYTPDGRVEAQPRSGAASGESADRGVALLDIVTDRTLSPRNLDRFPPPLLDRAEPPTPPAGRAPAATPDPTGLRPDAPSSDSPNEVHVHIGRIEVTAVQEAPPRPSARSRRPALSLDEYLARRQKESS